MSFIEGYPQGQEVVVYDVHEHTCHKARIAGQRIGMIADRFPYLIYKVELSDGRMNDFSHSMVFAKSDWDGKELHYSNKTNFELNVRYSEHDPIIVEGLIIQALIAEE